MGILSIVIVASQITKIEIHLLITDIKTAAKPFGKNINLDPCLTPHTRIITKKTWKSNE